MYRIENICLDDIIINPEINSDGVLKCCKLTKAIFAVDDRFHSLQVNHNNFSFLNYLKKLNVMARNQPMAKIVRTWRKYCRRGLMIVINDSYDLKWN